VCKNLGQKVPSLDPVVSLVTGLMPLLQRSYFQHHLQIYDPCLAWGVHAHVRAGFEPVERPSAQVSRLCAGRGLAPASHQRHLGKDPLY